MSVLPCMKSQAMYGVYHTIATLLDGFVHNISIDQTCMITKLIR